MVAVTYFKRLPTQHQRIMWESSTFLWLVASLVVAVAIVAPASTAATATERAKKSAEPQWGTLDKDPAGTNFAVAHFDAQNWTRSFEYGKSGNHGNTSDPATGWAPYRGTYNGAVTANGQVLAVMSLTKGFGIAVAAFDAGSGNTSWLTPLSLISDNLSSPPIVLVNSDGDIVVVGIASGRTLPTALYILEGGTGAPQVATVFSQLAQGSLGRLAAALGPSGTLYVVAATTVGLVDKKGNLTSAKRVPDTTDVWFTDASVTSNNLLVLHGSDGVNGDVTVLQVDAATGQPSTLYVTPAFMTSTSVMHPEEGTLYFCSQSPNGSTLVALDLDSLAVLHQRNFTKAFCSQLVLDPSPQRPRLFASIQTYADAGGSHRHLVPTIQGMAPDLSTLWAVQPPAGYDQFSLFGVRDGGGYSGAGAGLVMAYATRQEGEEEGGAAQGRGTQHPPMALFLDGASGRSLASAAVASGTLLAFAAADTASFAAVALTHQDSVVLGSLVVDG